jgi:mono/diheme cytochrome c family protein
LQIGSERYTLSCELPRPAFAFSALLFLISLTQAEPPHEQKAFVPKGRAPAGKTLFVEKNCFQCHSADGISLPKSEPDQTLITTYLQSIEE